MNAVEQHNARAAATTVAGAFRMIDQLAADRDVLVEKVQALYAERDNLIASIPDTAALADFLKHALADRDQLEDRVTELEGEVRVLTDAIDEASA